MTRSLITTILLSALVLLVLGGWAYLKQRDLMYFPQFTRDAPAADFELPVEGAVLRGWVVNPGQEDAILYFGGNAEPVQAMRGDLAQWFPAHSSYLVPYRGYGASSGDPSESALSSDALAVYDFVRARHPDGDIHVIGRSLGSGVASYLAARRPVARLVLVTPFDSMANVAQGHYRWLPVRWLLRDRYEASQHLQEYEGPVLVVRASEDRIVPPIRTERLVESLPVRPKVVTLEGADHNTLSAVPGYRRAIVDFIQAPTPR